MSSSEEDFEKHENDRYMSNTMRLHRVAAEMKIPTAYIIVERKDDKNAKDGSSNLEVGDKYNYINGIKYTMERLSFGILLMDVYVDVHSKNEQLSFDLTIGIFIDVLDHMAFIDSELMRGTLPGEIFNLIEDDFFESLIIYRYLKMFEKNEKRMFKHAKMVDEDQFTDIETLKKYMAHFDLSFGSLKACDTKKTNYERYCNEDIVKIVSDYEKLYSNRKNDNLSRYDSIDKVMNSKDRFIGDYARYFADDAHRLQDMDKNREILMGIKENTDDPVIVTELIIEDGSVIFGPQIDDFTPTDIDGLDIFNDSIATKYVPFIQYNDENNDRYYKLLTGNINFDTLGLSPRDVQVSTKNTIYAILWLDNPSVSALEKDDNVMDWKAIVDSHNNSFYPINYQLDDGLLEISTPSLTRKNHVSDMNEITARFRASFPNLNISKIEDKKMKGYFDVLGVEFDETTFLHALMVEPIFFRHMYVEEKLRPFPFKHRMDIHYNGLYSYMGEKIKTISPETTTKLPFEYKSVSFSVHLIQLSETEGEDLGLETFAAIRFSINGGARPEMIDEARETIKTLFYYYKELHKKFVVMYDAFIHEDDRKMLNSRHYNYTRITNTVAGEKNEENEENEENVPKQTVKELREKIPELFTKGYAHICQNNGQPVIIDPKDVEKWESKTFELKGVIKNRQVMDFPPDDPQWKFGCKSDKKPFPGVRKNTTENKEEFATVPCCYEIDHISEGSKSLYNQIYRGKKRKGTASNPKTPINTDKIIKPGQTGYLPEPLINILNKYREGVKLPGEKEGWIFLRTGIKKSPNSVIHALLTATMNSTYAKAKDDIEKNKVVKYVREEILNSVDMSLMKQEMFDVSEEDIRKELANENSLLDPEKFTRALEEYFQINIFTFALSKSNDVVLVIPRHRSFYVKVSRSNRPTVLLLRQYYSITDYAKYPHTELIIDINLNKSANLKAVTLFDLGMLAICKNLFEATSGNVTWFQHQNTPVNLNEKALPIYPHFNFYNQVEIPTLLGIGSNKYGSNLVGQYIDPMGKARAFVVKYYPDPKKETSFFKTTFIFPPTSPENTKSLTLEGLTEVHSKRLVELMGESLPMSVYVDSEDFALGIWYKFFDLDEGIYIPIKKIKVENLHHIFSELPRGSPNPLKRQSIRKTTIAERYNKLKKTIETFFEIVEWLFEIYKESISENYFEDGDKFSGLIFTRSEDSEEEIDSIDFYDFSNLSRIWPVVDNLGEALIYLKETISPTDDDGKIVLYSEKFEKGVSNRIREYIDKTFGRSPEAKPTIKSFFRYPSDFTKRQSNVVIIGPENLKKWLSVNQESKSREFLIVEKLDLFITSILDPIIHLDSNKKFWIIQNSNCGSKNSALAIARNWYVAGVNTGPGTKALSEEEIPSHFIHVISEGQILVAAEDHTAQKDEIFFHIIKYHEGMYGTLLPMSDPMN
jgi:hypothetical protein